ncbi:MAG: uroporphyrinogen-III C-methyltransferase [Nitrospinaceae bacterium]
MAAKHPETGTVALVGAGPGDPGLITLRGRDWLQRADVVVYDHLANERLLGFAPPTTEFIYAGKKAGRATMAQAAINRLLIDKAGQGQTVVRLKGGDPFIFGRGGEEAVALKEAGVPFVVVPGVSSPMGVSAYAGIPLTHRDHSSTISIITGSNEKGKEDLHIDWEKIASRSGTLVFLMGARKLPHICSNLMQYGKDPATPIAVIQWGTTFRQKTLTGTLDSIVERARTEHIQPPALTIVGEVVDLLPQVSWFETLPLFSKTVVITRAGDQAGAFGERLLERGAEPFLFPVIQTAAPADYAPLDAAIREIGVYDAVIFTSANGVRWFMRRLHHHGLDIRELKGKRIYCIGPKTEAAVRALGIRVDAVPDEFVAESLLTTLESEGVKGRRFLLPRAAAAREILPEKLRSLGAVIDVPPTYQTLRPPTDTALLRSRLEAGSIHAITFTSSSTVHHFMEMIGDPMKETLGPVAIACIGPVTAATARNHGLKVAVQADPFTVEGLMTALETFFQAPSPGGGA